MSLFCFCVVDDLVEKSEIQLYAEQIKIIANRNNRGVKFSVDWSEPILSHINKEALFINILDFPESDNCELLFLPDGWYFNAETNEKSFRERMRFLQEISEIFTRDKYCVDLYFGQSGTPLKDFTDVKSEKNKLADYLTKAFGFCGVDGGVHISVIP